MMGKSTPFKHRSSDDSAERLRRSRRKFELEEIRRNALAAKRSLKVKRVDPRLAKATFIKTLGQFSDARREIENAVQSQGTLLNREVPPKIIEDRILPKPLRLEGFLRAGIKGRKIKRHPSDENKKFREAVLNNDLLGILQSGGLSNRNQQELENVPVQPVNNNIDSYAKTQIKNFLSSPFNLNKENPTLNGRMINRSPVLGGSKGNKNYLSDIAADWSLPSLLNDSSKIEQSPIIKQTTKEDRCKRRLFDNENQHVNNAKVPDFNKTRSSNSNSIGQSTPGNGIYFAEYVPKENMGDKKENNYRIKPSDPRLMSVFMKTSKAIAEVELKELFLDHYQAPAETIKTTLKSVYTNAYNNYLQQQREHSVERTPLSSNSEIMLEPDSAIARIVKKNNQILSKKSILKNKSSSFVNNLNGEESNVPEKMNKFKNLQSKRKRVPSSKGDTDERVIPSSTIANANSDCAKLESSMDSLHPSRQELIARYLKDIDTSKALESGDEIQNARQFFSQQSNKIKGKGRHHLKKKKVYVTDVVLESNILNKGTKHVPAILRKSRSQNDYIIKDKIVLVKEYSKSNEMSNETFLDLGSSDDLENRFKPNCVDTKSSRLMEAPKCKYVHINSEYNQPSISGSFSQSNNFENNDGCNKRLVQAPANMENKFSRHVSYEVSPMKHQLNVQNDLDYHQYQLSQENQGSNCMTRIISFGDIQEKTNRLTLHSSQSQHCSQESSEHKHSFKDHYYGPNSDYYETYKPPNNHAMYNYQSCRTLVEIPSSQSMEAQSSQNYRCCPPRINNYLEKQPYVVEQTYELVPSTNYSSHQSKDFDYYQQDNHVTYGKPIPLQYQQGPVNAIPLHHQSQPSKFFGVEENRKPQRRPVYNPKDINNCSFTHRQSVPNQQSTKLIRVPISRNVTNNPGYSISSMGFKSQDPPQTVISPDFEYNNVHFGNVIDSQVRSSDFSSEMSARHRNINNYVPDNSNHSFVAQQNAPVYTDVSNQRYTKKPVQMQMQMPSPLSSQVEYQDNCYSNSQTRRINDVYFQHMNFNNHKKRP